MPEEPENLTLRLLQELREELREVKEEARETRKDLINRIDGNTLLLNMLAGLVHDHEERLTKLEG